MAHYQLFLYWWGVVQKFRIKPTTGDRSILRGVRRNFSAKEIDIRFELRV